MSSSLGIFVSHDDNYRGHSATIVSATTSSKGEVGVITLSVTRICTLIQAQINHPVRKRKSVPKLNCLDFSRESSEKKCLKVTKKKGSENVTSP